MCVHVKILYQFKDQINKKLPGHVTLENTRVNEVEVDREGKREI